MKVHTLIFNIEAFGITSKSLKMLRNILSNSLQDEILILEIQTEEILCGFLIFNKTNNSVSWTGDGFRTDGGGEGGRGYKAAYKLIELFGARVWQVYDEISIKQFQEALKLNNQPEFSQLLLNASNQIVTGFPTREFESLYNLTPKY